MSTTEKQASLAVVTIFAAGSTAALASGSNALSASFDFSQANAAIQGYSLGRWVLSATAGAAPTANTGWQVHLLISPDGGTTFETDPGRSTAPVSPPITVIPATAADNLAFVRSSARVDAPCLTAKVILYNNGTGQQLNAGWSLQFVPISFQGV